MNQKGLALNIIVLIAVVVIIAGGIFVWQYLKVPREKAKVTEAPEEIIKDETTNWKTYRNEKYNYEIRYPNDWDSPIESGDTDALTGNYSSFFKKENILVAFSINVYENDENLSLKEWWEQEFYEKFTVKYEYSHDGFVSISPEVEAVRYRIQRMGFEDNCFLISKNQKVYTIYFSLLPGAEEIQQIISTFRFLE